MGTRKLPPFVLLQISKQFVHLVTIYHLNNHNFNDNFHMVETTIFSLCHIKSSNVHRQFTISGRCKGMAIHEFKELCKHAYVSLVVKFKSRPPQNMCH